MEIKPRSAIESGALLSVTVVLDTALVTLPFHFFALFLSLATMFSVLADCFFQLRFRFLYLFFALIVMVASCRGQSHHCQCRAQKERSRYSSNV
jgi:hypothetical protein